jgi:peptide deformylase
VARPTSITIEYMDIDGKTQILKADNYNARIILHEMDHLDGVLFLDKLAE